MCVFFLTSGVPIKFSGLALTSPTKLVSYESCCFLISALISLLKVSNFALISALPDFLLSQELHFFYDSFF